MKTIGDKAPLDYVVASHVVEHVPDLAGWLEEVNASLKIGGRLLLVVPDKRFTFDILRPLTTYSEIITAYKEQRRRPGLRSMCDHFANVVHADTYKI